jgi:hypothetical protein
VKSVALGPGFSTAPVVVKSGAEHDAVVPPLVQLQCHGPLPLTTEAVPVLQKFLVGALLTATPFDKPHNSLTGGGGGDTETTTSIVELPGTLLVAPDTMSKKTSSP